MPVAFVLQIGNDVLCVLFVFGYDVLHGVSQSRFDGKLHAHRRLYYFGDDATNSPLKVEVAFCVLHKPFNGEAEAVVVLFHFNEQRMLGFQRRNTAAELHQILGQSFETVFFVVVFADVFVVFVGKRLAFVHGLFEVGLVYGKIGVFGVQSVLFDEKVLIFGL